jgi:nicotinamide riboside kinase
MLINAAKSCGVIHKSLILNCVKARFETRVTKIYARSYMACMTKATVASQPTEYDKVRSHGMPAV